VEIPITYALKFNQQQLFQSERDELIQKFYDGDVQAFDRLTKKYRRADKKVIAIILRYEPIEDLEAFYRQCSADRSFSWFFPWS
jgi:hypothetical protein